MTGKELHVCTFPFSASPDGTSNDSIGVFQLNVSNHEDSLPTGLFRCDDGEYIQSLLVCSGRPDCRDGSDESGCQNGKAISANPIMPTHTDLFFPMSPYRLV